MVNLYYGEKNVLFVRITAATCNDGSERRVTIDANVHKCKLARLKIDGLK